MVWYGMIVDLAVHNLLFSIWSLSDYILQRSKIAAAYPFITLIYILQYTYNWIDGNHFLFTSIPSLPAQIPIYRGRVQTTGPLIERADY